MSTAYVLPEFSTELSGAVAANAESDADRVGLFLQAPGLQASANRPLSLPAGFLLDLGAALRLLDWERKGLPIHRDAGLPPAREILVDLFRAVTGTEPGLPAPSGELAYRVMVLFIECFAWNGRRELDAEVALSKADEEAVLEALADFLWEHRPR